MDSESILLKLSDPRKNAKSRLFYGATHRTSQARKIGMVQKTANLGNIRHSDAVQINYQEPLSIFK